MTKEEMEKRILSLEGIVTDQQMEINELRILLKTQKEEIEDLSRKVAD